MQDKAESRLIVTADSLNYAGLYLDQWDRLVQEMPESDQAYLLNGNCKAPPATATEGWWYHLTLPPRNLLNIVNHLQRNHVFVEYPVWIAGLWFYADDTCKEDRAYLVRQQWAKNGSHAAAQGSVCVEFQRLGQG